MNIMCYLLYAESSKVKVKLLSRVRLFATPWTVAYQASPSMGFPRQEYWSGLPFPSPGDLPDPGIEPRSPTLEADTLTSEPPGKPKIWCKWTSLQNRKRLTDLENSIMVTGVRRVEERETWGVWTRHTHTAVFKTDDQRTCCTAQGTLFKYSVIA